MIMKPLSRAMALVLAGSALLLGGCEQGGDARRDHLRIVGEAAVLPIAEAMGQRMMAELAEQGREIEAPVMVATGNDAGFARLCTGIGPRHDDMVVATRRMTAAEYARCAANNARDVVEVPVGTADATDQPVYLYVKALHAYGVPSLHDYLLAWREHWGPGQLLDGAGLKPLDPAGRARSARIVEGLEPLDRHGLS
jgi:hypothetical protein